MKRIPVLKPNEKITVLNKLGFEQIRQRGSHIQFRHPDGRGTIVPNHKGRDVSPILLKQIIKDIRIDIDDFLKFL